MYSDIKNDLITNVLFTLQSDNINSNIVLFIKDNICITKIVKLFNNHNVNITCDSFDNLLINNTLVGSTIIGKDILCFTHNDVVYMFDNLYNPMYSKITNKYNCKYIHVPTKCKYMSHIQKLLICLLIYCDKSISDSDIINVYNHDKPIIKIFARYLLKLCYLDGIINGTDYYLFTDNTKYLQKYLDNNKISGLLYKLSKSNYKLIVSINNNISLSIIDCIKYIYIPRTTDNPCYINIDDLLDMISYMYDYGKPNNCLKNKLILWIIQISVKDNVINNKINILLDKIDTLTEYNKSRINMKNIIYIFEHNYVDIIKVLFDKQINMDYYYQDINGNTILHHLCINKNYEIIKHVYKLSNICSINKNNKAPIDFIKHDDNIKAIFNITNINNTNICIQSDFL